MNEEFYFSKEKLDELKKELAYLESERRGEIIKVLEYAKSLGDLSENAEYHNARDDQGKNEEKIQKLEHMIRNAKIIEEKAGSSQVNIGSNIVVRLNNAEISYNIVSPEEANISEGKISYKSPIGMLFLGKSVGDRVEFKTPNGENKYTILKIL